MNSLQQNTIEIIQRMLKSMRGSNLHLIDYIPGIVDQIAQF